MAMFTAAEDGLFHCDVPGCSQPGYKHPQHLGLHRFHAHGIKGESRSSDYRERPRPRGRPPKNRPVMLSAEDVCSAALEAVAPNGSIPVAAIGAYNEWVRATQAFFTLLLG
jgi:hypothetical protein